MDHDFNFWSTTGYLDILGNSKSPTNQVEINGDGTLRAYFSYNPDNTIYVDDDGGADYTHIQDAIDVSLEGGTVFVHSGTYSEVVDINKSITLIGEEKSNTIINPVPENNKYSVRLAASDIEISGFRIINRNPSLYSTGIWIYASKTKIYDCDVYDTKVGITVWASENIIENCCFWGCEDEGIALIGNEYSGCNNNEITNCEFYDNCDGIELQYASANTITNCEFYNNTHTGIDAIYKSNNNNQISGCKIYNNAVNGIYFSRSNLNIITKNDISSNVDGGIILTECSNNCIFENNLKGDRVIANDNGENFWYSPSNKKGNYWSDYKARYPDASDNNNDGIWDTPYDISGGNNKDLFPLHDEEKSHSKQKTSIYNIISRLLEKFFVQKILVKIIFLI
jgi:parallel beta-helix repeat protein